MSSWTIYSKQGTPKYKVDNLEFHDMWMGEEYVMVNITSPTPLDIEIGDYLIYRGLTYSVYSVPSALKQARRGSYGEAFKYDNIKLSSRGVELTDLRFLDYVLEDNNIHYTSLPTFSFHCMTVDDLLDRLQANTDRDGGNQWYFISPSYSRTMQRYQPGTAAYTEAARLWDEHFGGDHGVEPSYERTDVNISIDKQSVWDGLIHIKNDFNLNFIMRERAVIVGGEGIAAGHVFQYGKGNGLYQIERVADQDQKVTTKLFAYGSDKNLPVRYYANLTRVCFAKMYLRPSAGSNILYLDFEWNRSYVTGTADSNGKFPVVVSINGTTYSVKAYPMEVGARNLFTIEASVSLGFVTTNMDIIFVSGIDKDKFPASNVRQESGGLPNNMAVQVLMLPGFPIYALSDLCRCTYSGGYTIFEVRKTPSDSYSEFMRVDGNHPVTFSNDPLKPYILSGNADTIGIKEGDVHFVEDNDDNGLKEIYPSIEGMTRGDVEGTSSTERLDEIVSCDVIQDNGVFAEGVEIQNFNLVLKDIGFDLKQAFDNAGGNMTISMKDGYCGGRDFNVHSVKANSNGTWTLNVERSHDEGLDLYFPYSTNAAIGQTPTADEPYQIRTGDHFVLTEIEIGDTSYIWAAAVKMLRRGITYLLNNDYTRFTYLPKVDEIYMARQHDLSSGSTERSLHDTLKSGMLMLFDDEDLGIDGSVFIDSLTIKENGNNGIPTYDVALRNDKQIGTIQRIQNQINTLSSFVAGGNGGGLSVAQIRSLINAYGAGLFLSKLNDDTAQGFIRFIQGLQVGNQFVTGLLGEGAVFRKEADGTTYMEADKLYIRMKAYFDTVVIREYRHEVGNRVASVAGAKCVRVAWYNSSNVELEQTAENLSSVDYFRCFFRASDGQDTVRNDFIVGDQVYCHITSVETSSDNPEQKGLNMKHYWRLCIGRNVEGTLTANGEAWIDISNRSSETLTIGGNSYTHAGYQTGSDVPAPQDSMIQLGCIHDTDRQGAIIEYVTGANAPAYQIYQGINDFSLNGKSKIIIGYNSQTGHAEMKVYGDVYIGDPNGTTYIEYKQDDGTQQHNPVLNIKARINASSTIGNQSLPDYIKANQKTYDTAIAELIAETEDLQAQIDGSIESYFMSGVPTLNTPPVRNSGGSTYDDPWLDGTETPSEAAAILNRHLGDLYYDKDTGHGYRFMYDSDTSAFVWYLLTDEDVVQALALAAQAQSTADGKSTTFLNNTSDPDTTKRYPQNYKNGDTWILQVDATINGVAYKAGDILTSSADSETYSESHWSKQVRYTDDSAFNGYINAILNGSGASGNSATAAAAQRAIISALGGATVVDGGLMLTSLIGMRKYKGTGSVTDIANYDTWAGISGEYDASLTGGGIAAWYGGGMKDYETLTAAQKANGWNTERWAKSLLRFDGSGYLANDNIRWNESGIVTIANVYADVNGSSVSLSGSLQTLANLSNALPLTLRSGVTYLDPQYGFTNLSILGSPVATQQWVGQNYISIAFFDRLFRAYNGSTLVNANDTTSTIDNIKAMFGFWTQQYISALGQGTDGGGGGGQGDVTWQLLADPDTRQINITHLTTALGTLTGYTTSGKNYAVQKDSSNHLYVNVPWTDTVYTLPTASSSTKGGVKVGTTLAISNAVLNLKSDIVTAGTYTKVTVDTYGRVTAGYTLSASDIPDLRWDKITSGTPTTLSGYGITDAKIASGVITLGSNTITPVTSVAMSVPTGFSVSGSPVTKTGTLALTYASGYEGFTTTLKNRINTLWAMFTREGSGTAADPYVIKANYGLYTDSFLSALGQSSDGGGGGGQGDVTWALLASTATGGRTIDISYITNALTNGGYATQSWVQQQGYTTNIGTVTQVKVGSNAYNPSSGVVSLPAYPTTLPASDVQAWAKATTKPSYTLDEVTDGTTRRLIPYNIIGDYTTNSTNYTIFASVSSTSTSRFKDCIILLSGGGYYYTTTGLTGQWVVEMRSSNSGSPLMKAVCLIPPVSTTAISFGYYTDSEAGITYFGVKSTGRRGEIGITTILNNENLFTVYNTTTRLLFTEEPSGWTEVTYNTASLDVPSWAMASSKPTYTYSEVGAASASSVTTLQGYFDSSGAANSAVKLKTARTIWGQSFDGSANVSGAITGATTISASGNVSVGGTLAVTGITTLSAKLKVATGIGIEDASGNALLCLNPTSWSGVTSSQWGVGSGTCQGVIRSDNNPLVHMKNGTAYNIIDASGGTISGTLVLSNTTDLDAGSYTSPALVVGGTSSTAHMEIDANEIIAKSNASTITNLWINDIVRIDTESLMIGTIRLVYDSANNAIKVIKSDGTAANFYATGAISSLGIGNSSTDYFYRVKTQSSYNVNAQYDAALSLIQSGTNIPSGSAYGVLMTLPYRKPSGNTTTDYAAQIFLPNGDDSSYPNALFYRTSTASSWNSWQRVQGTSMSDERLKNKIGDVSLGIEQIANAPAIRFLWNRDDYDKYKHVGSIAQYWQKYLPEVVEEEYGGFYSMQYGVAALISTIITARKVVDHEKRIQELERENKRLKEMLNVA